MLWVFIKYTRLEDKTSLQENYKKKNKETKRLSHDTFPYSCSVNEASKTSQVLVNYRIPEVMTNYI